MIETNGHSTTGLRERGMGDLMKQLSSQVSTLVRQEVDLAKVEMAEKGKKAGAGAGMFGGAGAAGLMALGSLTAFLILALRLAIPAWAAALLVTALWAGLAGFLALQGRQKLREMGAPAPEMTIETMKEDVQWLKSRN